MQIFLRHDVAAAGKPRVLVADERRSANLVPRGVCGAIDEAEQIPRVEIAGARYLVDHRHRIAKRLEQDTLGLEADVRPLGADV